MQLLKLIIATHNNDKLKDLTYYMADSPYDVLPISHYTHNDPEETGATFEENALIKVRHSFEVTRLLSIADDSGFCMHALEDKPGIHAGRFAEKNGVRDFKYAFETLQKMLGDKDPATDFVCTLAYKDAAVEKVFRGVVAGYFDFEKSDQPGFGYTPIFVPLDNNPKKLSLAEMGDIMRRQFSARGKAAAMLKEWLTHS
ncbi:MAG: non-canonical purine NTP pyrophosphatase [Alphaproteobacteria bacterium]|nr:non-canonical purine NTP pyrophosphatase [Alphaproteobacteria bacterium]